jgi:hypothetical protein
MTMLDSAPTLLSIQRHAARLVLLAMMLITSSALPLAVTAADTEQLNGSWVLDEARSESYQDAVKVTKAQIMKVHKRHKKQEFGGSSHGGSNKYYEQENAAKELMAEDTIDVDWSLPGPLDTVMQAKTLKIYQSRMCAMLYDKKFKRLFAINPEGNSYSAKGTEFARDDIGRTFGYFEGQTLVVDTDIKGGDRLVERMQLNDAGDELTIVTKYRRTDLGRTLEYKRIFRRGE